MDELRYDAFDFTRVPWVLQEAKRTVRNVDCKKDRFASLHLYEKLTTPESDHTVSQYGNLPY